VVGLDLQHFFEHAEGASDVSLCGVDPRERDRRDGPVRRPERLEANVTANERGSVRKM